MNPSKGQASAVRSEGETGVRILQPSGWPTPKGYANGMAAEGRLVVTGGVIGWDVQGHLPPDKRCRTIDTGQDARDQRGPRHRLQRAAHVTSNVPPMSPFIRRDPG